jgi:hypothetical protein
VLAALLQLSADLTPADESLVRVGATAVVRGGEAFLLPADLIDFAKQLQPRLAKAGMAVVDAPRTLLDPTTHELVVPEPVVPHDASVLDELDADAQLGHELRRVRPGRYPVRTWYLTRSPDHLGPLSTGVAVTTALPQLFDLDDLRGRVEWLAELFGAVAPVGIWCQSAAELVDQVSAGTGA